MGGGGGYASSSHPVMLSDSLCRGKHREVGKLCGATDFMGPSQEYITACVMRPVPGDEANEWVPCEFHAGDVIRVGPMQHEVVLVRFIVAGDRRAAVSNFRRFILVGSHSGEVCTY